MYSRIVRFTDVDPERLSGLLDKMDERDGPPEGVDSTGITIYLDEEQRTAVVVQFFDSAEQMQASEAALDGMDPADTPGTRASIDRCELKKELSA